MDGARDCIHKPFSNVRLVILPGLCSIRPVKKSQEVLFCVENGQCIGIFCSSSNGGLVTIGEATRFVPIAGWLTSSWQARTYGGNRRSWTSRQPEPCTQHGVIEMGRDNET